MKIGYQQSQTQDSANGRILIIIEIIYTIKSDSQAPPVQEGAGIWVPGVAVYCTETQAN